MDNEVQNAPEVVPQESGLKRKLKNRHIQFIALGSSIGTGLFLGSASAIFSTGPSVILAYLLAGFLVFLVMRQLGEMSTNEPAAGSSSYFADKYWNGFAGFLVGWTYWIDCLLVGIAELIAVAGYMQYWFPDLAIWKTALLFFLLINVVNLLTVKVYGEIEFLFSSVKIITICAMILFGGYILFFNSGLIPGATIRNLWDAPTVGMFAGDPIFKGFFTHGFIEFMLTFPIIIFAFSGVEFVGITAAETENPQVTIPKAVNQVVFRILLFYVGSLVVILSLYHWSNLSPSDSPFVLIFDKVGFKYVAWTLNFIVLTAALSVYNTCIFFNSRMLYSLALQKNASKIFKKTNKRGIPVASILVSGILTFSVVPLSYFTPNWVEAFEIIISFSVICVIINWAIIAISHLKFRKQKNLENIKTLFPSPFYPFSNYLTIIFLIFILFTMSLPIFGMLKQVIALPLWILVLYTVYRIVIKKSNTLTQPQQP
ncbi:MAG: amino acid permease [Endomicrobium sp.]|jgi:L-asparagine transporter-like permease|nr:amino acid permease [Endomicrobium sp.]MDR2399878.1 amino acid permease [Endomicrobium sp.]